MNTYWKPIDEELAQKVMGWKLVKLSDPGFEGSWPAWPRETVMRLAWFVQDPADACCRIEAPEGTGEDGKFEPHWIPSFSTNLKEAMRIWDKMRELGHRWLLNADTEGFHLRRVITVTHDLRQDVKRYDVDFPLGWAKNVAELPKVICEAALLEIADEKSV